MNIDLTPLLANFNATYIIIPVLAVATVFLTVVVVILSVTIIIDIIRGDFEKGSSRFFGGYKPKIPDIFGPVDNRDDLFLDRYRREKKESDYRNWKKDRGF